jgi:hypothetical protein
VVSAPARFFVLTLAGLIILGALGLEFLAGRVGRLWPAVVVGALLLSAVELPVHSPTRVVEAGEPPPIVRRVIELVPDGAPIAQYPSVDRSLRPVADQFFWQRAHGHPLLNGAERGTLEDLVRVGLADPGRSETAAALALLGFQWATYEPLAFAFVGSVSDALAYRPPPGMHLVRKEPDGSMLLRVTAAPAAGVGVLGRGFSPEGGDPHMQWLEGRYASLLVCATAEGAYRLSFDAAAFHRDRELLIGHDRVFIPATGRISRLDAEVQLSRGWQSVPVRLVGSEPTRPLDVLPDSADGRFISARLGTVALAGPQGPSQVCRMHPERGDG